MADLGRWGEDSYAYGVNDAGQVVGRSSDRAVLWTGSGMTDLGHLGGARSSAYGINNVGQVVGASTTANGATHAFVWIPATGLVDLGVGDGGTSSVATAINAAGQMVGWIDGTQPEAVLWSGPLQDLAVDFGEPYGVWTAHQGGSWRPVHGRSPVAMVTGDLDGNGLDDLVLNFGPGIGVYAWLNHATWSFLHLSSPSQMVTGDLDHDGADDIVFVFPGAGVWCWTIGPGTRGTWTLLRDLDATRLAVGNPSGYNSTYCTPPRRGRRTSTATDKMTSWPPFLAGTSGSIATTPRGRRCSG